MHDNALCSVCVEQFTDIFICPYARSQPNEEDGPEESLTSKEFDRFLAERAAAADTLPTITSQAGASSTASPSPRAKAKKEEESLMAL